MEANKYVAWSDVSRHPNSKACKPWAQRITGTHEKYGVDGEWLDKQTIDGDVHFDVSGLTPGDIIKVSGASHNNKKHAYYKIKSINGELKLEGMDESEVIEAMEQPDELDELKSELMEAIEACENRDTLEAVKEEL